MSTTRAKINECIRRHAAQGGLRQARERSSQMAIANLERAFPELPEGWRHLDSWERFFEEFVHKKIPDRAYLEWAFEKGGEEAVTRMLADHEIRIDAVRGYYRYLESIGAE